jgi:hypothetical protein
MVTLSLPLMFGLMAMVVDIGWAYWRQEACKTAAQSAAEAAARAAQLASNLTCGSGVTCQATTTACPSSPTTPPSNNLMNGCLYAQANGYTAGGNNSRQNVSYSAGTAGNPVSGVSPNYWVRFTVVEKIPALFTSMFGAQWQMVSANATAGVFAGVQGGCVYVLGPGTAWTQSGGNFSTGCGVKINGAASMSGGNLTLGSNVYMDVGTTMTQSGGVISPAANMLQNQGSVTNPVSGVVAPTAGSCLPNPNVSSGTSTTIGAGTYCSGISISGGTGIVLSGIIDITGGSFTMSGGIVTTAAGGATLYFGPSAGTISISGGNLTLTAPTSGSTNGLAIWKDGTTASSASISGSNTTISGIIDMPQTAMTYSGGNSPVNQTIIVYTMSMSGGNISQAATSPYLSNGGAAAGAYLIQ